MIVAAGLIRYWFDDMGLVGGDSGLGGGCATTGVSLFFNCFNANELCFICLNCEVIDGEEFVGFFIQKSTGFPVTAIWWLSLAWSSINNFASLRSASALIISSGNDRLEGGKRDNHMIIDFSPLISKGVKCAWVDGGGNDDDDEFETFPKHKYCNIKNMNKNTIN